MIQTFNIPNRDYDALILSATLFARAQNEARRDYEHACDESCWRAWPDDNTPERQQKTLNQLFQDED